MVGNKLVYKLIFFSILIGGVYLLLLILFEYVLVSVLPLEFFQTEADIQKIYMIEYLSILSVLIGLFFLNKHLLVLNITSVKNAKAYYLPLLLAFFAKIVNDPIYRFEEIMGVKNIMEGTNYIALLSITSLLIFVKSVIVVPIVEEIVFRGYILGRFVKAKKYCIIGLISSSLIFSLMHLEPKAIFSALVIGSILGMVYLRFGVNI